MMNNKKILQQIKNNTKAHETWEPNCAKHNMKQKHQWSHH